MLRVLPWITDGATDFIDNFINERTRRGLETRVFEFGSGNSTLYFLSKGCSVVSIEHDFEWADKVLTTAEAFGYKEKLKLHKSERPYCQLYQDSGFDITVIDGRDRVQCFLHVLDSIVNRDQIIVFDNTERFDYIYKDAVKLFKKYDLRSIHFEQHQLEQDGKRYTTRTYARDRSYHRHITSVCYLQGMYTTDGKSLLRDSTWD
jgi:predicted O-methyltransferase YrrM